MKTSFTNAIAHGRLAALLIVGLTASSLFANHGLVDPYQNRVHWERPCSSIVCPATVYVYNSVSYYTLFGVPANWSDHLYKAVYGDASNPNVANRRGWDASDALQLYIIYSATDLNTRNNCPYVDNSIRVCNAHYGPTGWDGLAENYVDINGRIIKARSRMNDYYTSQTTSRRHVMCQELGHNFGLGHTSVDGSSQNTCMDYYRNINSFDFASTGPNQHDFDQILIQHNWGILPTALNPVTLSFPDDDDGDVTEPWEWGRPVHLDLQGRADVFIRPAGDGSDHSILTYVSWADDEAGIDAGGRDDRN